MITGSDWIGVREILHLDGMEGLRYVAEKLGAALVSEPDFWVDNYAIEQHQEKNSQINVREELDEAAKNNRFIKLYLEAIDSFTGHHADRKKDTTVYNDVVEEILLSTVNVRSLGMQRNWTEPQLLLIAKQLLIERNQQNKLRLLSVFKKFRFPLDCDFILKLVDQKARSSKKMADTAIKVLSLLTGESIRQFALERISTSRDPERYIGILQSNYMEGDSRILTEVVKSAKTETVVESLASSLDAIYSANKTRECLEPLVALYDRSNCAIHRNSILKILIDNDVLPTEIKDETRFDCDEDIRKLAFTV